MGAVINIMRAILQAGGWASLGYVWNDLVDRLSGRPTAQTGSQTPGRVEWLSQRLGLPWWVILLIGGLIGYFLIKQSRK